MLQWVRARWGRRRWLKKKAPVRWHSVSSTTEYERCPRRYHFGYIERRPYERHVPTSWRIGSAMHAGLEAAYRFRQAHPDRPLLDGVVPAVRGLIDSWEAEELPPDPRMLYRTIWFMTNALERDVVDSDRVLGVEVAVRGHIDGVEGERIAGFADLIVARSDDTIEIVDHKVTRWQRDPAELVDDFQLNLYGALARNRWPWATHVLASHHYPVYPAVVQVELTEAGMEAAVRRVHDVAARIRADETFAPTPGAHCGHCPWLPLCPEGSAETAPVDVAS